MRVATDDDSAPADPNPGAIFRFPLGSRNSVVNPMPPTTSLLALAGVVGFALLSLLFGIFT
jgi:hypothetical protein